MPFRVLALALLAVAGVLAAAPAVADTPQPLRGHTGPGFEIGLVDANGTDVKAIDKPGTYTFTIDDLSELHNFHLIGPGVDKETSIDGQGAETWTLDLASGTYNYFCTPHATIMKGSFTVGAPATTTPPTTTTPKPPPAALQKLSAKVGAATISFAARAKAGKAQITVRDLSGKQNFHLSGPGVNKKTTLGFTGTVKWAVTLKAGTYMFRSDASAKLRGKTQVR